MDDNNYIPRLIDNVLEFSLISKGEVIVEGPSGV